MVLRNQAARHLALLLLLLVAVTTLLAYAGFQNEHFQGKIFEFRNLLLAPDTVVPDTNEYAPRLSAVDQIKDAPDARYAGDHKLLPNVLWMSPRYFGGTGQKGINQKQIIANSKAIMLSLAKRMNYYLVLPGNSYGIQGYNDTNTIAGAYIDLANRNPDLPASVIMFWGQIKPRLCGYKYNVPAIFRTDFPDSYYIKWGNKKRLSPAAPDDSLAMDGKVLRCYLEQLCKNLKRPVQLVNENGEVFKLFGKGMLQNDPSCVKEKAGRNIADWDEYEATRRLEKEKRVQKEFLDLPCLSEAIYTVYGIDGHRTYRHKYEQTRLINSKINGQNYSTPDFYPRWPSNWKYWKGAWHGFKWISDCRKVEIANGDHLYSPFVSAGWDNDEVKNIRPGQWLGLLKALAVTGAEFYYTGFFSLKAPFPKPENYAWQALMPAYAQAVTSRFEDILRDGELLNPPSYNFAKKDDELIVVRKARKRNMYVITGTVQPVSNHKGSSPLVRKSTITLEGKEISFMIRRQGSTYILDLEKEKPVFYQLDGWHEYTHPLRWKMNEQIFEGELYDNKKGEPEIETEETLVSDLTSFTSYISLEKGKVATYKADFIKSQKQLYCWAKARSDKGVLKLEISGEEKNVSVNSSKWKWILLGSIPDFKKGELTLSGENIKLDKVLMSHSSSPPND